MKMTPNIIIAILLFAAGIVFQVFLSSDLFSMWEKQGFRKGNRKK